MGYLIKNAYDQILTNKHNSFTNSNINVTHELKDIIIIYSMCLIKKIFIDKNESTSPIIVFKSCFFFQILLLIQIFPTLFRLYMFNPIMYVSSTALFIELRFYLKNGYRNVFDI